MTDAEIAFIESELGVSLPESYRQSLVPFRIPAMRGNTDSELWDDAARLVALNRELRAGTRFRPAWPSYLFAVGDPHGDELIALDTRSTDGPVWWLDHGLVDGKSSYQSHQRFADWVEQFYRDTRSDLESDGFNADGTPQDLSATRSASEKQGFLDCLAVIVVIIIAIAANIYFRG